MYAPLPAAPKNGLQRAGNQGKLLKFSDFLRAPSALRGQNGPESACAVLGALAIWLPLSLFGALV
jgi:hypothetical protein